MEQRNPFDISIDVAALVDQEVHRVEQEIENAELGALIARYRFKGTHAGQLIAHALGFRNRHAYEAEVLRAAQTDDETRAIICRLLGEAAARLSDSASAEVAAI